MRKIEPEELRLLQLDLLREFADFCEKHQITYYIAYGTLLGAVRHGGFIPWDDDVDVMMPHQEFEKFAALYQSDKYKVAFCKTDKVFGYPFGRLVNTETCNMCGKFEMDGVNIDIYPMYGCPASNAGRQQHLKKFWRLLTVSDFLLRVRSKLARMGLWPKKTLNFHLNNAILRKQVKLLEQYPYGTSEYVYISVDRKVYPVCLFEQSCKISFEHITVDAPCKYDEWLTLRYGDYMKLPPIEQRVPYHHGNYYYHDIK